MKPPVVVKGAKRGGQIWAITDDVVTIRCHAAHSILRDYDVPVSLAPGFSLGDAVVVTVSGDWPFTITHVASTRFADHAPSDQARSVAEGTFSPGCVPLDPGESPYWWES